MSEPPPVDSSLPLDTPAQSRWPGLIAWAIVWIVAIYLVVGNIHPDHGGGGESSADSSVADLQLKVAGKTLMGMKWLEASAANAPSTRSQDLDRSLLFGQVDALAKTPSQKLRIAILSAEMQSSEEASKRLVSLSENKELSASVREDVESVQSIYASGPSSLDASKREHLLQREGYFGEVALSYGLPPADPLRQKVLAEGRKIVLLSSALFVVGLIGAVLSIGLFITAIVLIATGKIRPFYRPQPQASTVYIEMFAVWLVSYLTLSVLASWIAGERLSLVWTWLLTLALPITFTWGMMRGIGWNELRHSLGWHTGRGWYIELPLGLAGYIAGLPIIAAGVGMTLLLVWLSGATPSHPIMGASAGSSLNVLLLFSIASGMAPVMEETMFRGALFHHMRRKWSWLISSLVVAVIFAAIHPQGWTLIPALSSIAVVLAGLREWRGSLLAPMVAHGFHNGILITMLVVVSS